MNGLPSDKQYARRPPVLGWLALIAVAIGAAAWTVSRGPFGQNPAYHCFADQRSLLGLPHALNVLSNAPFFLVGALGLGFLARREALRQGGPFRQPVERWPFV